METFSLNFRSFMGTRGKSSVSGVWGFMDRVWDYVVRGKNEDW